MRRIPIRLLLAFSLVAVTCISFSCASNLIFSVFTRTLWMDYSKEVEIHLQRTVGDGIGPVGSLYDPILTARAMQKPLERATSLPDNLQEIARQISAERFQVFLFDRNTKLQVRYPDALPLELATPASVFELLNMRCREYRFRLQQKRQLGEDVLEWPGLERPSFFKRLFFGPVGIFGFSQEFRYKKYYIGVLQYLHLHHWEGLQVAESERGQAAKNAAITGDSTSVHPGGKPPQGGPGPDPGHRPHHENGRHLRHMQTELQLVDKISAEGISLFSPPGMNRVTYELPEDLHVMVAPIFCNGRLEGFVQVISSWAFQKQILYDFATQICAIGVLVAMCIVVLSYFVSDWVLRPLKSVVETARSVTAGDLSARTGLPKGRNEFYMVGHTLDRMVDNLQEAFVEQRRFIGDASHELKTPITSLLGVAQVLSIIRQELGDNPQMDKSLATMNRELERMTELVRDLLLLSRSSELSMKLSTDPISVAELIDDACQASLSGVMNRNIVKVPGHDLWLLGDIGLLSRAVRNVIDNALRHTPEDKKVSVSFAKVGEEVCIEVDDEGCGIKAEHLKDLGKRFFRTDKGRARGQGGTGLGLAITRTVVERHKGRLEITSQEGQGTQVKIFLPLPDETLLDNEAE